MAKEIEYAVPPAAMPGAHDELAELIETLHRSGTLRVLNDFIGRLGALSDVALDDLCSPAGRNLVGTLLAAGKFAASVPADDLLAVGTGIASGMEGAKRILSAEKPPGTWALLHLLHDPVTRRAIGAGLVLLNKVGAQLQIRATRDLSGRHG